MAVKKPARIAGRKRTSDRSTPWHDSWYLRTVVPAIAPRGSQRALAEFVAGPSAANASIRAVQNKLTKVARGETIFNGDEVLAIQAWLKTKSATARAAQN